MFNRKLKKLTACLDDLPDCFKFLICLSYKKELEIKDIITDAWKDSLVM